MSFQNNTVPQVEQISSGDLIRFSLPEQDVNFLDLYDQKGSLVDVYGVVLDVPKDPSKATIFDVTSDYPRIQSRTLTSAVKPVSHDAFLGFHKRLQQRIQDEYHKQGNPLVQAFLSRMGYNVGYALDVCNSDSLTLLSPISSPKTGIFLVRGQYEFGGHVFNGRQFDVFDNNASEFKQPGVSEGNLSAYLWKMNEGVFSQIPRRVDVPAGEAILSGYICAEVPPCGLDDVSNYFASQ